jgi:hypothetical protein
MHSGLINEMFHQFVIETEQFKVSPAIAVRPYVIICGLLQCQIPHSLADTTQNLNVLVHGANGIHVHALSGQLSPEASSIFFPHKSINGST